MSDTIYIVTGSAGDYDGYNEWNCCFYLDEDQAREHVRLANIEQSRMDRDYEYRQSKRDKFFEERQRQRGFAAFTSEDHELYKTIQEPPDLRNPYDDGNNFQYQADYDYAGLREGHVKP